MHSYGVLEGVLLATTSLIVLWVQGFVALPMSLPIPESLPLTIVTSVDDSANRAPRQSNWNRSVFDIFRGERSLDTPVPQKADGFRVFAKKLQDDYHRKSGYNATTVPPMAVTKGTTVHRMRITKSGIRLFAAPQDVPEEGATEAAGGDEAESVADEATTDAAGGETKDEATNGTKKETELAVNIPKFYTNQYGENVYDQWGVTFGQEFFDTRFGPANRQNRRMTIDPNPVTNYYPSMENLTTICSYPTTAYAQNEKKVMKWLFRHVYSKKKKVRPIFFALRRELYDKANSEVCHTEAFSDWLQYQQCAVRRNMRMEYFIPKYPMQQLAFN
ncbi:uncharacterized protein LOC108143341 [Drosophila elegans]|uniref:uncharacterized protein LOC108143341 n=1 Tax=Drosophila elegans TaxID=30023 RepID=UPI0007E66010|nr:uncharacterized protein LOC108143341 [Drosophila elegans]